MLFAEDERWIQRYIMEYPEEFKGRTITFESRLDAGEKVRRVDVVTDGSLLPHYCYESLDDYKKVPKEVINYDHMISDD